MTKYLPFLYDENKYFTNQKCFILTGKHLKFLTGCLNAKVSSYWIKENCPELQGGTRELSKVFFENLPIPQIPKGEQKPFTERADQIIALKKQGKDTTAVEKEIDGLVYGLYGLAKEEIKEVEKQSR